MRQFRPLPSYAGVVAYPFTKFQGCFKLAYYDDPVDNSGTEMATSDGAQTGKGSTGVTPLGHVQFVDCAAHEDALGVGLAATAKQSAGQSVLVKEGNPIPGIPVKVREHLASGAFGMARLGGRGMTVLGGLNVKLVFLRSSIVIPFVKHAPQFGGGHVLKGV